jgi:hypothetical protein
MKKNTKIILALLCFIVPFAVTVYLHELYIEHCVKQIKKERAEGILKDSQLINR